MSVGVPALSEEDFLSALDAVGAECRIRADRSLVLRQFPAPFTLDSLAEALRLLGVPAVIGPVSAASSPNRHSLIALIRETPADNQRIGTAVASTRVQDFQQHISLGWFDPLTRLVNRIGDPRTPGVPLRQLRGQMLGVALHFEPAATHGVSDDAPRAVDTGWRWIIAAMARHRRIWAEVLVASFFVQLLALVMPLIAQSIFDKVIVHQATSTLWVLGAALSLAIIFSGAMSWARQLLILHAGNSIDRELGDRVLGHVIGLPLRWFERRPTGTIIARLQGIEAIREFLSGAMVTVMLDLPFATVFLGIMLWYSWPLTVVVLTLLLALTGFSLIAAPVLRRRLNRQFHSGARIQAMLTEYLAGMESVKTLQMEPQLRERYRLLLGNLLADTLGARRLSNALATIGTVLEQLSTGMVLCAGAWLVMQNSGFTIGMLVAFQMFSSRLSQPLLRLSGLWLQFQQASIALERLDDLLQARAETVNVAVRQASQNAGDIRVENVSFRYSSSAPPVLDAFSLEMRRGQCVLLAGPSGCGKSTLAKLLLGFRLPDSGVIRLDGRDITTLASNELRRHFGVVLQDTVLFSGTLLENLELASPGIDMDAIVTACRLAGIHDDINGFGEGYQTRIGEHGTGLSGGQRQRIAIARALLRRPSVLICDEALNHLDADSSGQVVRTLNGLHGRVSVLFIAHAAPAGMHFDTVIDMPAANVPKAA